MTETWLNRSVFDSEIFDDRYNVYRRDRESSGFHASKNGGGVLIAVSKQINSERFFSFESKCEDLWVCVEVENDQGKSERLYICAVYIPPPVQKHIFEHFINNSSRVLESLDENIIVAGDFNLSNITWSLEPHGHLCAKYSNSYLQNLLTDFLSCNELNQFNLIKNSKNKMLDLVLSNTNIVDIQSCPDPLTCVDPLHPPLVFSIDFTDPVPLVPNNTITKFCFHKADYENIRKDLNEIDWREILGECLCVDDMVAIFYDIIRKLIRKYVPKAKPRSHKYPVWFTACLIKCIKEKYKYRMKVRKYNNPRDKLCFDLLKRRCEGMLAYSYAKYIKRLELSLKSNPKLIWSFLKQKKGKNSYPSKIKDDNKFVYNGTDNVLKRLDFRKGAGADGIPSIFVRNCANALALPIALIINRSLRTSTYPTLWKEALVLPLFKTGDKEEAKNYRPISIISVFAKVFDKLICPVVSWHFKQFVISEQHGFAKARSTVTNLVSFVEDITESLDTGQSVDEIYTDFSKAFDKVDHSILLVKLKRIGIANPLLDWFKSYLAKRSSTVVVDGYASVQFFSYTGVPQGSHLGPLLFNIFINDISNCFKNSKSYLFADDLKIFRCVSSNSDTEFLQEDLNNLTLWCRSNGMTLNADKCHVIKFSRKKTSLATTYYIDGRILSEVPHIRDLGVILDNKLRYNIHIDNVVNKGFRTLGFIFRNCKQFKDARTKIIIYSALVRSILEYCSVVWNPHFNIYSQRIERIQKRFLFHLSYDHNLVKTLRTYEDKLFYFKLQPLSNRRQLLDLIFLYKLVNGVIDSSYLLAKLNFRTPLKSKRPSSFTPFVEKSTRSRQARYSPINRLMLSFNAIYKLSHKNCIGAIMTTDNKHKDRKVDIDIFSDNLWKFKRDLLHLLSPNNCNSH